MNPYSQLDLEEEELEYKVGDESTSEIHPDDDEADDLSCITIDSLKHIDNDKGQRNLEGDGKRLNDNKRGSITKIWQEWLMK